MGTSKISVLSTLNGHALTEPQHHSEPSELHLRNARATSRSGTVESHRKLSNLLSLPRELRDVIYDLALQDASLNEAFASAAWWSAQEEGWRGKPPPSPYPHLLCVNKQIRAEAEDIFYSTAIHAKILGTYWPLKLNTTARSLLQNAKVLDIDLADTTICGQPLLVGSYLAVLLDVLSDRHSLKILTLSWRAQSHDFIFAGIKKQLDRTYSVDSVGNIFRPMCERLAEIEGLHKITTFVVSINARKGQPAESYDRRLVDILSDK